MYEARRFRQVPIIYGSCTDEGTKNVDKTVTSQTLDAVLRNKLGNMNDTQLNEIKTIYPDSLNNVTFSGAILNATYPGAGNEWQRLSGKWFSFRILRVKANPLATGHFLDSKNEGTC